MKNLLNEQEQENLIHLIESCGLCRSSEKRITFLIEINLPTKYEIVEMAEHDFLVELIYRLVQTENKKSLRLILTKIAPFYERQKILDLERRLESVDYRPSQPTPKPAYFVDNQVFQLMPLDIGTIWGLQRSSFIGLLIGFEKTEIYENLKNVEFVLSQSIEEVNLSVNTLAVGLPKREWIRVDINNRFGVPCQKSHVMNVVVDLSNEVSQHLKDNSFPDLNIPGFFFDVNVSELNSIGYEKIISWCNALLNQLFPSHSVALIINIIAATFDEFLSGDTVQKVTRLKNQLRRISEDIPIELMRLDPRLFFTNNILLIESGNIGFSNIERKPGLPFCSWMYTVFAYNSRNTNLSDEKKYKAIFALYEEFRGRYSPEELRNVYSSITEKDVLLDIQMIAPTILGKAYESWLQLILNTCPQWSYQWVGICAESGIEEAILAALVMSINAGLLSDLLIEAWSDAINLEMFNLDLLYRAGVFSLENNATFSHKLEILFLGLLRKEKAENSRIVQDVLQDVIDCAPYFKELHDLCQNQEENENRFLFQNDPNKFSLAIRAKVTFRRVMSQFKESPVSHLPIPICWLLAAMPPSRENIVDLLRLDLKKRAIFGICTHQEWQHMKIKAAIVKEVLDCRRERPLIFTPSHL
jgi:hypothetical protein